MSQTNNTLDKIAVMQAFIGGKKIECKHRRFPEPVFKGWCECHTPTWDWDTFDYRVKESLMDVYASGTGLPGPGAAHVKGLQAVFDYAFKKGQESK